MLTSYIAAAMAKARYKIIDDGSYFGEISGLPGIWADAKNLEACRAELQEVLEDWLIVKLRDGDPIPRIGRVQLATKTA
jgi:predicted RNase H-like HicB family nuclease